MPNEVTPKGAQRMKGNPQAICDCDSMNCGVPRHRQEHDEGLGCKVWLCEPIELKSSVGEERDRPTEAEYDQFIAHNCGGTCGCVECVRYSRRVRDSFELAKRGKEVEQAQDWVRELAKTTAISVHHCSTLSLIEKRIEQAIREVCARQKAECEKEFKCRK